MSAAANAARDLFPGSILSAVFSNGPIVAGAVASTDDFVGSRDGFPAGAGVVDQAAFLALAAHFAANYPPRISEAVAAAIIVLRIAPSLAHPTAACAQAPAWIGDVAPAPATYAADLARATQDALALVSVCKVNYWKTNHHTGQGVVTSYLLKLFKLWGIEGIDEKTKQLVWKCAHWFDTRVVLFGLGIKLPPPDSAVAWGSLVTAGEDVLLRISSNPAGTAKWADGYALIKLALATAEGAIILGPLVTLTKKDDETATALKSGFPQYHVGSEYLSNMPRVILGEWPEPALHAAFTVVVTKFKGHSLLACHAFVGWAPDPVISGRLGAMAKAYSKMDSAQVAASGGALSAITTAVANSGADAVAIVDIARSFLSQAVKD